MTEGEDISGISGNASDEVKQTLSDAHAFFNNRTLIGDVKGPIFGEAITRRVVVTEVSVDKKVEEPLKMEGRVVCEITVEDGEILFVP